jgi:antirestriction protein ArdC
LCFGLGITADPREDRASYMQHRMQTLKEDKRAIFTAAAQAQKVVDDLQPAAKVEPAGMGGAP